MAVLDKNSVVEDYKLRQKRLVVPFSITANATPANKSHNVDLPGVMYLRTQGKTAEADAVDSGGSFTTPADNSTGCIFGILISGIGLVKKLLRYEVFAPSTATTIAAKGSSSSGVTATSGSGSAAFNSIAVECTAGSGNLATTNYSATLIVDYLMAK